MSGLREEIIESEKTRSDLLKWKLIIVAALGTVGLGVKGSGTPSMVGAFFVLLLIPLVCFYVDLLCWHTKLRIMTIGEFLRLGLGNSAVERDYEEFVSKSTQMGPKKLNIFALEDWALEWSTWVLSVLVILAGWTLPEIRQMSGSISIMGTVVPEYTMVRGMFLVAGPAPI